MVLSSPESAAAAAASAAVAEPNSSNKETDLFTLQLGEEICFKRNEFYSLLIQQIAESAEFFRSRPRTNYAENFLETCIGVGLELESLQPYLSELTRSVADYDYSSEKPGNGYRSLIAVADACLLHIMRILRDIRRQRNSLVFAAKHHYKELDAYCNVFKATAGGMRYALRFLSVTEPGQLYSDNDAIFNDLMQEVESVDQTVFFGRAMAFQFCSSLRRPFNIVGVGLASFSEGFETNDAGIVQTAVSLLSSGKYLLSAEKRAERIVQVTRDANIEFCKAFWSISETDFIQQLSTSSLPNLPVNEMMEIPCNESIFLPKSNESSSGPSSNEMVEVLIPSIYTGQRPLKVRLLSHALREGMKLAGKSKTGPVEGGGRLPLSPNLVLHCHGGGFVAQSSRSHEMYLRHWANTLKAPIVSIDYSLAPENPYPRAQQEVYYAYAYVLANPHRFGWTGEKICLCGDSAGGNLVLTITLRAIAAEIKRLPDGLVMIYTPFLIRYSPSPSRFLSLMDPLLPLGIVSRCMAAYTGNTSVFDVARWPKRLTQRHQGDSNENTHEKARRTDRQPVEDQKTPIPGSTSGPIPPSSTSPMEIFSPTEETERAGLMNYLKFQIPSKTAAAKDFCDSPNRRSMLNKRLSTQSASSVDTFYSVVQTPTSADAGENFRQFENVDDSRTQKNVDDSRTQKNVDDSILSTLQEETASFLQQEAELEAEAEAEVKMEAEMKAEVEMEGEVEEPEDASSTNVEIRRDPNSIYVGCDSHDAEFLKEIEQDIEILRSKNGFTTGPSTVNVEISK